MGAAMGWTVHDVKRASMWEFFAAWHGFVDAGTPKQKARITDAQADELFEWLDGGASGQRTLATPTYWLDGNKLVPARVVQFDVQ